MSGRKFLESLDKTLKDIVGSSDKPFGWKSILLGGDFRQTLPVKPKASKTEILNSSLPKSYLWPFFKVFKLTENMRLQRVDMDLAYKLQIASFSSWLLKVGDGVFGFPGDDDPLNSKRIQIPTEYIIHQNTTVVDELIGFIYDYFTLEDPSAHGLSQKAIVCPRNEMSHEINMNVLNFASAESKIYLSTNFVIQYTSYHGEPCLLLPPEYLAMLTFSSLPPHKLKLKVNALVILLHNINQTLGLCNGTQLIVTQLLPGVVEAQIIVGTYTYHESLYRTPKNLLCHDNS